jgi:hypothetical protein
MEGKKRLPRRWASSPREQTAALAPWVQTMVAAVAVVVPDSQEVTAALELAAMAVTA